MKIGDTVYSIRKKDSDKTFKAYKNILKGFIIDVKYVKSTKEVESISVFCLDDKDETTGALIELRNTEFVKIVLTEKI